MKINIELDAEEYETVGVYGIERGIGDIALAIKAMIREHKGILEQGMIHASSKVVM